MRKQAIITALLALVVMARQGQRLTVKMNLER